jgi:hypothetical protein
MRLLRILALVMFIVGGLGIVGCDSEKKAEGVKAPPAEDSGVKGPQGPRPMPPGK